MCGHSLCRLCVLVTFSGWLELWLVWPQSFMHSGCPNWTMKSEVGVDWGVLMVYELRALQQNCWSWNESKVASGYSVYGGAGALKGQQKLKWLQAGLSWGFPCRGWAGVTAKAELGANQSIPGYSAQGVLWPTYWHRDPCEGIVPECSMQGVLWDTWNWYRHRLKFLEHSMQRTSWQGGWLWMSAGRLWSPLC